MSVSGRMLTSLVMLAIFAGMTAMALQYPPKAQLMPLIVGIPATIMALAQLILDARRAWRERPSTAEADEARIERHKELGMFAWTALLLVGILAFGFEYAAPALVFAFLWLGQRESLAISVGGGIGVWLLMYGVFNQLLGLPLFEGLVTQMLT